jgi:Ca-activated chloride channel homolog
MDMLRLANPGYLYGLFLIPLFLLLFILSLQWKKKVLKHFGDREIIKKLYPDVSSGKQVLKFVLICLAFALVAVGIADPQLGTKLEEVTRKGVDIIIALDVSNSMKAQDIRPSRLERSKQAIYKLIDKLNNDRIGLIVFAGRAYTQLPITTDYGAAKLVLTSIDNEVVPTQGTAIGEAIELAMRSFQQDNRKNKAVIVITDGENHEDDAIGAAKKADSAGVIIHTIGMGSPEGGPIPVFYNNTQVGFKQDNQGNTIVSKLDPVLLQQVAAAGGGKFVQASNSEDGLNAILEEINKMEKKSFGSKLYTDYEDRFQYFLAAALLILIAELLIPERKSRWLSKINLFGEGKA